MLWPLVLLGGTAALAMNFQTLLPLFARDALGMDSGGYGAMYAAMGLGALVGSLALAFMAHRRPMRGPHHRRRRDLPDPRVRARVRAHASAGASRSSSGIGLTSMLMVNTINVTIQNSVPDALRGRVMSLYVTVFAGTAPIGGLIAGALAQAFGAPVALSVGAALGGVVLVLVAWQLRAVRAPTGSAAAVRRASRAPATA